MIYQHRMKTEESRCGGCLIVARAELQQLAQDKEESCCGGCL